MERKSGQEEKRGKRNRRKARKKEEVMEKAANKDVKGNRNNKKIKMHYGYLTFAVTERKRTSVNRLVEESLLHACVIISPVERFRTDFLSIVPVWQKVQEREQPT